ncbi:hypothetical protein LAZ67_1002348, partial [Cordylochernes scorpioides]
MAKKKRLDTSPHIVLQFLAKHSITQLSHPPYSPDLAPNDLFLDPKLKMKLKGRNFNNKEYIYSEKLCIQIFVQFSEILNNSCHLLPKYSLDFMKSATQTQ